MYVVTSNNRQILLVSSCFDCFAFDITEEDEFKIDKKHGNLARIPEFSRELLLAGYIK